MDQFNWGVHRHSLSSLNAEGEKDNITQATPTSSRKVRLFDSDIYWKYFTRADSIGSKWQSHGIEESSDDEMGSVSPLDDMETTHGHEFPLQTPPSSLPLDLNCSHSEIHSDSSLVALFFLACYAFEPKKK